MEDYLLIQSDDIKRRIDRIFGLSYPYEVVIAFEHQKKAAQLLAVGKDKTVHVYSDRMDFGVLSFHTQHKCLDVDYIKPNEDGTCEIKHFEGYPYCYFKMKPTIEDLKKEDSKKSYSCDCFQKIDSIEYAIIKDDTMPEHYICVETTNRIQKMPGHVFVFKKSKIIPVKHLVETPVIEKEAHVRIKK